MYNTTLTETKIISSGKNQGQIEYKTYGIAWDDNQYLSKSKIAEQPDMNGYNTHITSQDGTNISKVKKGYENNFV